MTQSAHSSAAAITTSRLVLLLLVALQMGCASMRGTPQRFQDTAEIVAAINLSAEELAQLVEASSTSERNRLQNRAVAVIDQNYQQFVRRLAEDRADAGAGASGTALVASTAGAFVDSVKAKTNYALFGAALVGAFGIVDKNYYFEKSVPALVAGMGASRARVLLRMRESQALSTTDYGGHMALADLEEYFSAGTLMAAIIEITAQAEETQKLAQAEIRTLSVPDDAEIERRKKLSAAIFGITSADLEKGKAVAKALGLVPLNDLKDLKTQLLRALRPPTAKRLDDMRNALRAQGLLN